jgi:quinolinate synthase
MELREYAALPDDELTSRVLSLKREKDAVILGHNYQVDGVQRVSDHLGDSLKLAQLATEIDASLIVLAGVRFMAESAKILSPDKKVLLPAEEAGCPMAGMINARELESFKAEHPGVPVVCYVNTTAEVKAGSDVCCTSSNAVDVVRGLESDRVLFVPDRNLGAYVASKVEAEVIVWDGHCYVHNAFVPEDVMLARSEHPGVPVVVHPECSPEVTELADHVASTGGMMELAREHDELIVGTEVGLIGRLNREHPEGSYYPLSAFAVCRTMKLTDLAGLAWALEHEQFEVDVPANVAERARAALTRMLELS